MNTPLTSLVVICAIIVSSYQGKLRYDNYQVYRVIPENVEQLKFLNHLQADPGLRFWREVTTVNRHVDIMVPPDRVNEFLQLIRSKQMKPKLFISNVQDLIDKERGKRNITDEFGWDDYHPLEEVRQLFLLLFTITAVLD